MSGERLTWDERIPVQPVGANTRSARLLAMIALSHPLRTTLRLRRLAHPGHLEDACLLGSPGTVIGFGEVFVHTGRTDRSPCRQARVEDTQASAVIGTLQAPDDHRDVEGFVHALEAEFFAAYPELLRQSADHPKPRLGDSSLPRADGARGDAEEVCQFVLGEQPALAVLLDSVHWRQFTTNMALGVD